VDVSQLPKSGSTLNQLATVLKASPESDALLILGRLLDSLPIGFHLTNCGPAFEIVYANRTWERWLGPDRWPVAGKTLIELFPSAEPVAVLKIMRQVCDTARPEHLKQFEFGALKLPEKGERRERSLWDWEVYPLAGPDGEVTHLLNVVMNVGGSAPTPRRQSGDDRQAENRRREAASGVLRIFGFAPEPSTPKGTEQLSQREYGVAELMALGFTNAAIGRRLNVTPATVSSHVAHILAKLGFRSRAQVAAWIVARRLREAESSSASIDNP
jgi:DNA-binding CsgD family transcriptional regulator